jgi:GNAT superfamily N-acetyltransferase
LKKEVQITTFQPKHQSDIDQMMEQISLEFEQNILIENYKKIIDLFYLENYKFWVAIVNKKVVGTIGFFELESKNGEIKKMYVDKSFRGKKISKLLLDTLIDWAIKNKFNQIYLGTMTQFKAAQRFYEKNGFEKINQSELPNDFIKFPLDSIFFSKQVGH